MDPTELLRQRLQRLQAAGVLGSSAGLHAGGQQSGATRDGAPFKLQPLPGLSMATGSSRPAPPPLGLRQQVNPHQMSMQSGAAVVPAAPKVYSRSSHASAGTHSMFGMLQPKGSPHSWAANHAPAAASDKENSNHDAGQRADAARPANKRLQQLKLLDAADKQQVRAEARVPLRSIDPNRAAAPQQTLKSASRLSPHYMASKERAAEHHRGRAEAASPGAAAGAAGGFALFATSPAALQRLSGSRSKRAAGGHPLKAGPASSASDYSTPSDSMDIDSGNTASADEDPSWGSEQEGDDGAASMSTSSAHAASGEHSQGLQDCSKPSGRRRTAQKRPAPDATAQVPLGMHSTAVQQSKKAATAGPPALGKKAPADVADGEVLLKLPASALTRAANLVLVELPPQFDVSGDMGAVGRVNGPAPRHSGAAPNSSGSGCSGSQVPVGSTNSQLAAQSNSNPAGEVQLDLKGVMYNLQQLPLAGTCAVVKLGAHGGSAQVECLLQSYVRAQAAACSEDDAVQAAAAASAYGRDFSSADEAQGCAAAADIKARPGQAGGRGGGKQIGSRGRRQPGRAKGKVRPASASGAGATLHKAAERVGKRQGGSGRGRRAHNSSGGRMACQAGGSEAMPVKETKRSAVSDSDDDYAPSG